MGILQGIVARLRRARFVFSDYDDESYWKDRGRGYSTEFEEMSPELRAEFDRQEELITALLQKIEFTSVLELGCGFGRVLGVIGKAFEQVKLSGCDVSEDQIAKARQYLEIYADRCDLQVASIHDLDFDRMGQIDLVYTSEVLTHIKDPLPIIEGMLKASARYIMNIELADSGDERSAPWVFAHDYPAIYDGLGIEIQETVDVGRGQRIFLIEKREG